MTTATEQAARERLARANEARAEQAAKRQDRDKWRPTPSQEENDLVAMGVSPEEVPKRDTLSGPDQHVVRARAMWPARKPEQGYETR